MEFYPTVTGDTEGVDPEDFPTCLSTPDLTLLRLRLSRGPGERRKENKHLVGDRSGVPSREREGETLRGLMTTLYPEDRYVRDFLGAGVTVQVPGKTRPSRNGR